MTGSANDYTNKAGLKFSLPAFTLPRWSAVCWSIGGAAYIDIFV